MELLGKTSSSRVTGGGGGGSGSSGIAGGNKRRRRLGVCHHSGTSLPAALRLLQDLARPNANNNNNTTTTTSSPALQRRNAFRKNSAPTAKPWSMMEIETSAASKADEQQPRRCSSQLTRPARRPAQQPHQHSSLTVVSRGISIISTPAAILLYVSSRGSGPDHCWRWNLAGTGQVGRRCTYPATPRGVRRHPTRRCSLADTNTVSSWIKPNSGVMRGDSVSPLLVYFITVMADSSEIALVARQLGAKGLMRTVYHAKGKK